MASMTRRDHFKVLAVLPGAILVGLLGVLGHALGGEEGRPESAESLFEGAPNAQQIPRKGNSGPGVNIDNLVPYTIPAAAWSDRHSDIAITWPRVGESGIQQLTAFVGWWGSSITDQLLSWRATKNSRRIDAKFVSRNFRPDKIVEVDAVANVRLTVSIAYLARNTLAVEFVFENPEATPSSLNIEFDYPGKGIAPDWEGTFPIGLITSIEGAPPGSWTTLFQHREHGHNVYGVSQFVTGMIEGTPLELTCVSDLTPRPVRIAPQSTAKFTVAMAFGRNRGTAQDGFNRASALIASGWTPAVETARIERLISAAPPLPHRYADEVHKRLYAHAITTLNSLFVYGDGGYFEGNRVPYTTKQGLAIPYFWDSMISAVGAREFDPMLSQETIEAFVRNSTPRGSLPFTLADTHRAGDGQAPILAWAAWKTYLRSRDKGWLSRIYPGMRGYVNYWCKYHSSPRGLLMYSNTGEIADNDARWDPAFGGKSIMYGMSTPPLKGIESPDLSAFIFNEMKYLGLIAIELGLDSESREWNDRREKLRKLIVDTMYFPEDAMFYDVKEGTTEKFSGVKNPNMFLPLWAGVPMPAEEVKRIIQNHLLSPAEFFKDDLPVPSLSFDNPEFNPSGYWRGRVWPHINYWMMEILWKNGYHAEADVLADRMMTAFESSPWLQENYPGDAAMIRKMGETTRSGESGHETRGLYAHSSSSPDYDWSAATLIEILLERYKEVTVP
jgi:hypothetical protein